MSKAKNIIFRKPFKGYSQIVFLFLLAIFIILFFMLTTNSQTILYQFEYYFLLLSFCIVYVCYILVVSQSRFDFFHSIHIYVVFYICIFFLTPLSLINVGRTSSFGVNIMGGCIDATVIVVLSLLSYFLGYNFSKPSFRVKLLREPMKINFSKKIVRISCILFFSLAIINLGIALTSGKSLMYIFSFGGGTYVKRDGITVGMLFLINLSYTMLVPWLFILVYSKSTIIKFLTTFILAALFFSYGWRFVIYIMAISYAIIYFRINKKQPSLIFLSSMVIGLVLFSVILGSVRNNMRSGKSSDFEGFSIENIAFTLESNFNIYQPFYGLVEHYPNDFDFTYGQAMFVYPFIMLIPRAIWADKPMGSDYPISVATKKTISEFAIDTAGMATPNIGEYYLDFGIIGVVIISLVIGVVSKKMLKFYYSPSIYDLITYAIFCGFLIQFINRGYIAQLFTLFIFLFSPLLLYRKYYK